MRRCFIAALTFVLVLGLGDHAAFAQEPDPVLGTVIVEGNTRTNRSVIDRVIGLEQGARFTLDEFDAVWDRLEDCGYFAFVDLDTEEDDEGNITLHVLVEEEKSLRFTPYIRYDRRHKYLLGAAMKDSNLGGRGETLEIQAVVYYIQRARARWSKPWLFGSDGTGLFVDAQWEQAGFVYRPFNYGAWHGILGLKQEITSNFYIEASGGYESFDQRDTYTWSVADEKVEFAAETRDTWMVRGLVGLDTRDNIYYPTKGLFTTYDLTYRFGGEIDGQTSHRLDLRGFIPLPGASILALRGFGQVVDNIQATEYVLRWGGPETVRGAPYARREGEIAYLATAEVRIPLFMMPVSVTGETVGVGLHAFSDVGDAYYDIEGQSTPRSMVSYGAGVHISLLTWQLRFEAAKERDHDWTFEFMDVFNF